MKSRGAAGVLLLLALAASAGSVSDSTSPLQALSDGRYAMGTVLEVSLHGPELAPLARARDRIFATAARLDALLSRYREDSDISRVNAAAGAGPVAVAPEVAALLRASIGHATLTSGSFDISVGPLVSLWTQAAKANALPSDADVVAARGRVGAARIHVTPDNRVSLEAGASIDLGGIAKGYALDRMLSVLQDADLTSALLSFGQSSVWAVGAPPDGPGWRLLARAPEGGFAGVVVLRDLALSVSGSLGQWSEIAGRRFGHVLDPRSGWPLTRRREAIVVAPGAELAEVLSKALLVLGESQGIALVAQIPGCEALLLDADGRRWSTPGFERVTAFEPMHPEGSR